MNSRQLGENYAQEFMLLGAVLTQDGDWDRIRKLIDPKLLDLHGPRVCLKAIADNDRQKIRDFLASVGVQQLDNERAIDAILRTFLLNRKAELEAVLLNVNDSITQENLRAEEKLKKNAPASA